MITRKNQILLSFLRVRAIVNGTMIYQLPKDQKIVIRVDSNNPKVVISDGFHLTEPMELVYHHLNTYYFKVVCVIGDLQLLSAFLLTTVLFLVGFFSGFLAVKIFSISPILYFLFFYYIRRKEFLQITPV